MTDADPLHNMERRIDRLEAKVDLSVQGVKSELDGLRDDVRRAEEEREKAEKRAEADRAAFVSLARYLPVEKIVYGLVTLALSTVVLAVIAIAFNGGQ